MEIKGRKIQFHKDVAFSFIDCKKDNPLYLEMELLYEKLKQELEVIIEPRGILTFVKGEALEEYAIVLYTLGQKVSDYVDSLFKQDEYMKAVLADAMLDSCLFSMEEEWKEMLVLECQKRGRGIAKRLEASVDFPIEVQKRLLEVAHGDRIGIELTSGYMFSPVKTCGYLFLLTEDMDQCKTDHDCSRCSNVTCLLRKEDKEEKTR